MNRVAPHSAGWNRRDPRNPPGPFGIAPSEGGTTDPTVGWGFSPWGTGELGWGDERILVPAWVRPQTLWHTRVFALARRGHFFDVPPAPVAAVQQDAPDSIHSPRTTRI